MLVGVHPDGPDLVEVRYLLAPFQSLDFGSLAADAVRGDRSQMWARGLAASAILTYHSTELVIPKGGLGITRQNQKPSRGTR